MLIFGFQPMSEGLNEAVASTLGLGSQRERDTVVSGPLRHFPDVSPCGDQVGDEAVPESVEGDV